MTKKNFKYLNELQNIVPLVISQSFKDENSIVLKSNYLLFSLNILKNHISYQYKLLSCISGVDLLDKSYRFSVCYDFLSLTFNTRLRVKTFIDEITFVPSCVSLYINANWWEREIWDMYGIYFDKHPDLRRILTDYGFEGYPMRKDFPLSGFIELRYDDSKKRIVAETVELTQEFRSFSFETPWN